MKVAEVQTLRDSEHEKQLRDSTYFKEIIGNSDIENFLYKIAEYFCCVTSNKSNVSREILKGMSNFKTILEVTDDRKGTMRDPHFLKLDLGEPLTGLVIYANSAFDDIEGAKDKYRNEYKAQVKRNYCFENCYRMAKVVSELSNVKNCSIYSGILTNPNARDGKNHLHSILLVNKKYSEGYLPLVLDFNHNLCMSADLYFLMFDFEVLNKLDAGFINQNKKVIDRSIEKGNFDALYINFAGADYIDWLKNPARQKSEPLDLGLNEFLNLILKNGKHF